MQYIHANTDSFLFFSIISCINHWYYYGNFKPKYVRYESVLFLFYLFILILYVRFEASGHIMSCWRLKIIPNTAIGNSSIYFVKVMNAKIMASLAYRTNYMYLDR